MSRLIALAIGLLSFLLSQGQSSCDKEKLSQRDKALLQQFAQQFKEAVNHKDKLQLAKLISFPFTCSYCIVDSTKERHKPYIKVSRKQFLSSQYSLFFTDYLTETVNQNDLFDALQVEETEMKQRCTYSFGFPIVKPSKTWEGVQGFFSIRKINGQYQIESAWTVP